MWLGKGKHFLTFPVRAGRLINYVGFVPADEEMKESWSAAGDPDVLRARICRLGSSHRDGAGAGADDFPLGSLRPRAVAGWSKGRLTLLGDAAHPMLPHMGQGANQSIEDGMALATILSRADRKSAPAALLAYERLRRRAGCRSPARLASRMACDTNSMYADLAVRDAELAAHAAFRKRCTITMWCPMRKRLRWRSHEALHVN